METIATTLVGTVQVARPVLSFEDRANAIEGVREVHMAIHDVADEIDANGDESDLCPLAMMRIKPDAGASQRMVVTDEFVVVGGLCFDHDCENPLESMDGEGHIYKSRGSESEQRQFYAALGLNSMGEINDEHPQLYAAGCAACVKALLADDDAVLSLRNSMSLNGKAITVADIGKKLLTMLQNGNLDSVREYLEPELPGCDLDTLWDRPYHDAIAKAWASGCTIAPDVVMLDVYEHGGVCYSVSGNGMQCRWDTSQRAAVWVPDECAKDNLRAHIKHKFNLDPDRTDVKQYNDVLKSEASTYCNGVLKTFNAWLAGDCWGLVVYVINRKTGRRVKVHDQEVWGMIGDQYAQEELEQEMLHAVEMVLQMSAPVVH